MATPLSQTLTMLVITSLFGFETCGMDRFDRTDSHRQEPPEPLNDRRYERKSNLVWRGDWVMYSRDSVGDHWPAPTCCCKETRLRYGTCMTDGTRTSRATEVGSGPRSILCTNVTSCRMDGVFGKLTVLGCRSRGCG